MKKFFAIVLALIIACSALSVSAFAADDVTISDILATEAVEIMGEDDEEVTEDEETTEGEDVTEGEDEAEDEPEEQPELKGVEFIEGLKDCDEWALLIKVSNLPTTELYVKGDSIAIVEYSGGSPYQKTIIQNGKQRICAMSFPCYYYEVDNRVDRKELISVTLDGVFGDMEFAESYVDGNTYVEVYDTAVYGKLYFNFEDGELENIYCPQTREDIRFAYEVDDNVMDTPFLAMNLTFIINFYLRLLIFFLG